MSKYDDILDVKFVKKNPKPMSIMDRAAQFSPFMALSGFEDTIKETGKEEILFKELNEDELNELNDKIINSLDKNVRITYFDNEKYITKEGIVRRIDINERIIILKTRIKINIDLIKSIELL